MGDAIKADGSTREEHKDVLGNLPVIVGARSTAETAEGSLFFQANDRVGIVQVVLPPDKKGGINEGLGSLAASLLVQLDPAAAAQLGAAPASPAVQPLAGTPKELLGQWLQRSPAITSDAVIEEQPSPDGKSSLVTLRPKTPDPKGLQTLTFGVYQADSAAAAPALLAKLGDARKAEGWTIDPSAIPLLGTRSTAVGSRENAGTTTVFLYFQANDRVGLVEATGPTEMGAAAIGQFVGAATADMLKTLDPSFVPAPAKAP